MDTSIVQHDAFGPGVDGFSDYIEAVSESKIKYDGNKFVELIIDFATILTTYLSDEINTLVTLERYDIDWGHCNKWITEHAIQSLDVVS
jgi:hypothetical protein